MEVCYDQIVRRMVSGTGLWTGKPATNFITAAIVDEEIDENKLAARAVRAFLGQRIDCAQCHDHPFVESWKQAHFEGLAAHFAGAEVTILGVEDKKNLEFTVQDRETLEDRVVTPAVPFHPEWVPESGTHRERLAAWITHPENHRFERAIANRIWGLMFGKSFHEPVDDLPDPGDSETALLDILGTDFREHGYELRRMIHVIAASKPFRLSSEHPSEDLEEIERLEQHWAVFPLIRLRPEQVVGSMLQAASIKTIDQNSHVLIRAIRFLREQDFVQEYGDLGENELGERSGTIPQVLLRMNGELSRDLVNANFISSAGRIASMTSTEEGCLETCYLVCVSRRPTHSELDHFLPQLRDAGAHQRARIVEDIFWTLFNSAEFSWNH